MSGEWDYILRIFLPLKVNFIPIFVVLVFYENGFSILMVNVPSLNNGFPFRNSPSFPIPIQTDTNTYLMNICHKPRGNDMNHM